METNFLLKVCLLIDTQLPGFLLPKPVPAGRAPFLLFYRRPKPALKKAKKPAPLRYLNCIKLLLARQITRMDA